MSLGGPGRELREKGGTPPAPPPRVNPSPRLADLPRWATVRETASLLTYEQAVHVASTILDDLKSGTIQRPYSAALRMSLETAALRIAQEATR